MGGCRGLPSLTLTLTLTLTLIGGLPSLTLKNSWSIRLKNERIGWASSLPWGVHVEWSRVGAGSIRVMPGSRLRLELGLCLGVGGAKDLGHVMDHRHVPPKGLIVELEPPIPGA